MDLGAYLTYQKINLPLCSPYIPIRVANKSIFREAYSKTRRLSILFSSTDQIIQHQESKICGAIWGLVKYFCVYSITSNLLIYSPSSPSYFQNRFYLFFYKHGSHFMLLHFENQAFLSPCYFSYTCSIQRIFFNGSLVRTSPTGPR